MAVQCRAQDDHIKKILKEINHKETETCALAEKFLKTLLVIVILQLGVLHS